MRLRYTLPALADLSAILDYITVYSPQGAKHVQARIQSIIGLLLSHPHIGTCTDNPAIRRLPTPPFPYLVFYEATEIKSSFMPCAMWPVILPECPAQLSSPNCTP